MILDDIAREFVMSLEEATRSMTKGAELATLRLQARLAGVDPDQPIPKPQGPEDRPPPADHPGKGDTDALARFGIKVDEKTAEPAEDDESPEPPPLRASDLGQAPRGGIPDAWQPW